MQPPIGAVLIAAALLASSVQAAGESRSIGIYGFAQADYI